MDNEGSAEVSSRPGSAAVASRPASAAATSRPASGAVKSRPATAATTSRPASAVASSRPTSAAAPSRPGSSVSRPASSTSHPSSSASRPASAAVYSRPASAMVSSRPVSGVAFSRAGSGRSSRPLSGISTKSSKAWNESETLSSPRSEISADESPLIQDEDLKTGCWNKFSTCVAGFWSTKDIKETTENKEMNVQISIRELVVYSIFLLILSIVSFGMTSPSHYYYTKVLQDLFSAQQEVQDINGFWEYVEGPLLDGLHWEYWYNQGDDRNFICPGGEETGGPCETSPSDRNVLFENKLLGLARLRQLRVRNDSCEIPSNFQGTILSCWAQYDEAYEDKSDFFPGYRSKTDIKAWSYNTAEDLGVVNLAITGEVGTYSGNGAVQNLGSDKNSSQDILHELKEALWISRSTRAVMIDFTLYNANLNLFCVINMLFEFPPTGGVLPDASFKTVKLLRYVNSADYFIMACEVIYVILIIYYIIEEILEIIKVRMAYFKVVWNHLDIAVVFLSVVNQSLNLYTYFTVETEIVKLLSEPDTYADFQGLGDASEMFKSVVAICVFFSWVKLFKYISFNKTMTQLTNTLSKCSLDILGFMVMFFIVFFAFAQLGYLMFGGSLLDYSTFGTAVFTLLRIILGDFDFPSLTQTSPFFGPLYFICYVFFVFFVLLNMFLAIINDSYSEVKADLAEQQHDFEVGDYFMKGYNNMLGKVGMRSKLIDIMNALKLANDNGSVTYQEVRQNLKKCNFSDLEIEMLFANYDIDGDGIFSMEEGAHIMADLENDQLDRRVEPVFEDILEADLEEASRPTRSAAQWRPMTGAYGVVNFEEFNMLNKRVDRMESVVHNIVSKIDVVLIKLETMERNKARRKATMGKMLDGILDDDRRKEMEDLMMKIDSESRPNTASKDGI
ncbi:polycystic kidney disease 2-like 1 protein [Eurytemora carolleeae]|uniref:polycystic kidney disease 2-like 1 protein n=1 Tax=Eurytemora carolleeae TaxID=1294199 RepID=UPI000C793816|nr:polycystic kidney disease 2-like 1 protein [Eurytemora carolleeae]|eukprot:XP_023329307.1 polycystic kidney disease 2-like 1 protein [Eurytemora affinis]